MNSISIELSIIGGLIILNGLFAMAEMAMVAAKKSRLRTRAESGDKAAATALALAEEPERFLSTVQIGITLIGILAGAFAGATVSQQLAQLFEGIPWMKGREEGIAVGIVVAAITFLSLIIGELVPKQLALRSPEAMACLVSRPMAAITRFAKPLVWLLAVCSRAMMKLMGLKPIDSERLTEEDLHVALREGRELGVVHPIEAEILEKAARLEDVPVRRIMTPRHDIVWLDAEAEPAENLRRMTETSHSSFPVIQGKTDRILGIAAVRRLYAAGYGHKPVDLESCTDKLTYVPESASLVKLLEVFKAQKINMVLVLDEYGGVEGLATLNDVLEAIVGDLPGVSDPADWFLDRGNGTYLVDGTISIKELGERLSLDLESNLPALSAETVGGYLYQALPGGYQVGSKAMLGPVELEIADLDRHRIDKILVIRPSLDLMEA